MAYIPRVNTLDRTRTCNLLLRRQLLYPFELLGLRSLAVHERQERLHRLLRGADAEVHGERLTVAVGRDAGVVQLLDRVPLVHDVLEVDVAPAERLRERHDRVAHLAGLAVGLVGARHQHRLERQLVHLDRHHRQGRERRVAAQEVNRGLLLTHSESPMNGESETGGIRTTVNPTTALKPWWEC